MDKVKKFYITQIDQNGELVIPHEFFKNIHCGIIDIETEDDRIIIKPSELDYTFT
jgi:isocitrate dehydrogenase kinase/phosphatase